MASADMTALRWWRERRAFTQRDLADRAGISQGYLAKIETGQSTPRLRVWFRLADALQVDINDLTEDAA